MYAGVLFVIGASGSGKTAAVKALARRALPHVAIHHFDSIGVPSERDMQREVGGGEGWQARATEQWKERLISDTNSCELALLEGQTRPSFIRAAFQDSPIAAIRIVLLDCTSEIRATRLAGPRAQPELANPRMDQWAAYLRGQADAFGLPIVDTSEMPIEAVADVLQGHLEQLRWNTRAIPGAFEV